MDNYTLAYYGKVTNTTVKPLMAQAQVNKKTLLVIKRKKKFCVQEVLKTLSH